jgi:hypothetical protein
MKMTLLTNPFGAGMEPVQQIPAELGDMRGAWGHLGPFDFGVGTRNLDVAARELDLQLESESQTIDLGGGASWRYAYFADPDGTYVCLTEARY